MPRRRKNNRWVQQGTKKSRRQRREQRRKQWFYVVVEGWREDIFAKWKNAKANVEGYPNNMHKKFDNLPDAVKWFNDNRRRPSSVKTPFPPHHNTSAPPVEYNPQYDVLHVDYDETSYDVDVDVPPYIAVAPAGVPPASFYPVRVMSQQIEADKANLTLDPPSCTNRYCGFCTGEHMEQRFACLQRLYQLNAQLSFVVSDGCNATRPDQKDPDGNDDDDMTSPGNSPG